MLKRIAQTTLLLLCIIPFEGCHQRSENNAIHFEVINDKIISDSLSVHLPYYKENFNQWKKIYEDCMQYSLFPNAFYLGLQENVYIGSISNQFVPNINKQFSVLDTSKNKHIFDLLSLNNSANCYTKIHLNKDLQNTFYNELIKSLKKSDQFQYLADLIDTNQISFKITTLVDQSIRPDSLVSLLQRSKDSSLLYFKQLLLTSGNVILARSCMIFGFISEFPLKRKLSPQEERKFKNEVFFNLGNAFNTGSVKLLPNQYLQVSINKYYTVLGQFYVFKEDQ